MPTDNTVSNVTAFLLHTVRRIRAFEEEDRMDPNDSAFRTQSIADLTDRAQTTIKRITPSQADSVLWQVAALGDRGDHINPLHSDLMSLIEYTLNPPQATFAIPDLSDFEELPF